MFLLVVIVSKFASLIFVLCILGLCKFEGVKLSHLKLPVCDLRRATVTVECDFRLVSPELWPMSRIFLRQQV